LPAAILDGIAAPQVIPFEARAVPVENWIYSRGAKQFVRVLTFRNGRLVAIDEGSVRQLVVA